MQTNTAIKQTDHRDQRYVALLLALETLLKSEFPVACDTDDVLRNITARRLFANHRISVAGEGIDAVQLPKDGTFRIANAIVQIVAETDSQSRRADAQITFDCTIDGQSVEFQCSSNQKTSPLVRRFVIASGPSLRALDRPDESFMLSQFQDLVAAIINDSAYVTRYRLITLSMVEDLAAALKVHGKVAKFATLSRKELLGRQLNRIANTAPDRSAFDSMRADIADAIALLNRGVTESLRRAFTSEGGAQARMFSEIDKINGADFARDVNKKAIRLSLNRDVQNDLLIAMRDLVDNNVLSVVARISGTIQDLSGMAARRIHQELHVDMACNGGEIAVEPLIERVADLVQMSIKYKGTLPRRGFFQRLAEGRKSIFAVLMFFSLFGSFLGFNWRNFAAFGWLFFLGFIVAVFHTYRSWVAEDKERIDDELEKAREHLRMESKRVFSEVFRELQVGCAETIDGHKRNLLAVAEERFRDAGVRIQRDAQIARETAQLVLKQIDARDKQLADFANSLGRLEGDLTQLRQEISR